MRYSSTSSPETSSFPVRPIWERLRRVSRSVPFPSTSSHIGIKPARVEAAIVPSSYLYPSNTINSWPHQPSSHSVQSSEVLSAVKFWGSSLRWAMMISANASMSSSLYSPVVSATGRGSSAGPSSSSSANAITLPDSTIVRARSIAKSFLILIFPCSSLFILCFPHGSPLPGGLPPPQTSGVPQGSKKASCAGIAHTRCHQQAQNTIQKPPPPRLVFKG